MSPIVTTTARTDYGSVKAAIHRKLIQKLNLDKLTDVNREEVRREVSLILEGIVHGESAPMNLQERERLAQEVLDEVFGLGPLEPLLADPTVSDILVNTYKRVFVERKGMLEPTSVQFRDDVHLMGIIDRIVSAIGRRIDESSPMVDARLLDGSRVNAIIPPLSVDGPCLSIRRFGRQRVTAEDLIHNRSLTQPMLELLRGCVKARLNILISGGTGAVAQRQLVINCLRMRPDRIIVGEVRGEEALDMLQAMNTGHDGSLTTIHANTPRDALTSIETMIAMGATNLPEKAMRQQIASAIQLVVQQTRLSDGSRKITSISEITGMEGDVITMQEIFVFEKMGVTQDGKVIGRFRATGVRPKCCERLKMSGIHIPADMFEGVTEVR